MPILKFLISLPEISLENLRLQDISNDTRTKLLDKTNFYKDEYKVDKNIYIFQNDVFFKFSKFFTKGEKDISAMFLRDNENIILIVPSRSYVFINGKSIDVEKYDINISEINISKLLSVNN